MLPVTLVTSKNYEFFMLFMKFLSLFLRKYLHIAIVEVNIAKQRQ